MTIIETDQSTEIKLTEIARGPFVLRYLSYRKREDAALGLRSEDYIVGYINPEKTIGILCDGVGSSFYGNLGSQILGESLLNWLGKVKSPRESKQAVEEWQNDLTRELNSELNHLTAPATSIIQQKELNNQNEMVRLAESTQRDDFGTQSNFACGIIWPRSTYLPQGLVLLFWLGNARIRVFNQNVDLTSRTGWGQYPDQLLEVWSSKDGVLGTIYSYVANLSEITHVIAYSDGLENADERIIPSLDGSQLEELVQYSQSIKDDDVTFLELSISNEEVVGLADDIVVPLRNRMQATVSHKMEQLPKAQSSPTTPKPVNASPTIQNKSLLGIWITVSIIIGITMFFAGYLFGVIRSNPDGKPKPTVEIPPATATVKPPEATVTPTNIPTETATLTPIVPTEAPNSVLVETAVAGTLTGIPVTKADLATLVPEQTVPAITPSP